MRKRFFIFLILLNALGLVHCQSPAGSYEDISTEEFARLSQKQEYKILDVRTPEEYQSGHLEKAFLLDYSSADFEQKASALSKDTTYLIYCRSGKRSSAAGHWLSEQGYRVYNLDGGILSWKGTLDK